MGPTPLRSNMTLPSISDQIVSPQPTESYQPSLPKLKASTRHAWIIAVRFKALAVHKAEILDSPSYINADTCHSAVALLCSSVTIMDSATFSRIFRHGTAINPARILASVKNISMLQTRYCIMAYAAL